jgi:hypothetical protein
MGEGGRGGGWERGRGRGRGWLLNTLKDAISGRISRLFIKLIEVDS